MLMLCLFPKSSLTTHAAIPEAHLCRDPQKSMRTSTSQWWWGDMVSVLEESIFSSRYMWNDSAAQWKRVCQNPEERGSLQHLNQVWPHWYPESGEFGGRFKNSEASSLLWTLSVVPSLLYRNLLQLKHVAPVLAMSAVGTFIYLADAVTDMPTASAPGNTITTKFWNMRAQA